MGGVFGLFSVYLRRWLHETPVFAELQLRKALAAEVPLKTVLRDHRGAIEILTQQHLLLSGINKDPDYTDCRNPPQVSLPPPVTEIPAWHRLSEPGLHRLGAPLTALVRQQTKGVALAAGAVWTSYQPAATPRLAVPAVCLERVCL